MAKTAGTSVVHFFRRHLPTELVCSHGDFLSWPEEPQARLAMAQRYRFLSGHFGFDLVEPLMPDAFSITFLRDPIDRLLSFYAFCLHEDMQRQFPVARAAASLGLEGFVQSDLPEVCEAVDNLQAWQLAGSYWHADRIEKGFSDETLFDLACDHLQRFSHVGLTETFDTDFAAVLASFGAAPQHVAPRQLVTAQPIARQDLSARALATLQERQAVDARLHAWVRDTRQSGPTS